MNLERHQIILGKVKCLTVVLIVSTSMASTATAQIVPPLAEGLIEETGDGISSFSLGYGSGIANYMCFEALKGNLAKVEGDEILDKYKLWFENQSSYQFDLFAKGYQLEMESFNKTFPDYNCNFSF
ncbi:hypothetical protein [Synechococcus sp. MIT S9508]|uniref:hypothetical protein n=1 Tax=Synechococcus sp. MIT S9508 TaxID=1801629 RepID=UPI0007BB63EC|nr:hypothetical protein [Synechococcus sp. MIT S9508]KZR89715.1 hypothetical protein MITS9508_01322 [Synechococcus sp. MIT S9508]